MNEMIAYNKRVEAAEKITSQAGSLFAMAPQKMEEDKLKPVHVENYARFL